LNMDYLNNIIYQITYCPGVPKHSAINHDNALASPHLYDNAVTNWPKNDVICDGVTINNVTCSWKLHRAEALFK